MIEYLTPNFHSGEIPPSGLTSFVSVEQAMADFIRGFGLPRGVFDDGGNTRLSTPLAKHFLGIQLTVLVNCTQTTTMSPSADEGTGAEAAPKDLTLPASWFQDQKVYELERRFILPRD
jgi:hypothetical protein